MNTKQQESGNRERRLDSIRRRADQLKELADRYDRLRYMAEADASEAFLDLAEAAGDMTSDSLGRLRSLLEVLWLAGNKLEPQQPSKCTRYFCMSNFG